MGVDDGPNSHTNKEKNGDDNMAADYSMTDDSWNTRLELIQDDLSNREDLSADLRTSIETFLMLGTQNPDTRKKWWQNISNVYSTLDNSPIKPGIRTNYPSTVMTNANAIGTIYADAYNALYNTHPVFGELERKRGRAAGAGFEDGEDFGAAKSKSKVSTILGYYRNYVAEDESKIRWDGTLNKSGCPSLIHPEMEDEA